MCRYLLLFLLALLVACSPAEEPGTVGVEPIGAPAMPRALAPASHGRVITLAADPWCPHNCTAGAALEGYMVDVAREVFGEAGYEVRYMNVSWARALQLTREGVVDGVVGAFVGDAPDFIFPDEPLGYSQINLYTHPQSQWLYRGIDSLRGQTLLAINGYSYSPELDAYIDAHLQNQERVWILSGPAPLNRAIYLLDQHRTDVFPEDRYVLEWAIRQLDDVAMPRTAGRLFEARTYIAFSPANPESPELARLLSEGTRTLRTSGRFSNLLASYGLTDVD
ncbi:MAG TPA: transporter substrate-binding domain-containing protein [Marinobacter sp.]|uniref:substrate-binding periplasmic protein n=1 Tax=Marinobacter sp. TaxID=50741 RepID=UPI002D7FB230|nr:transporter substrate-binding domain-containing protein [Marinobacter sp.]HET8802494.1 transporter substrate-binding domain-containing protein [Marinobacter sp.]